MTDYAAMLARHVREATGRHDDPSRDVESIVRGMADLIEAQAAEIARLREQVEKIGAAFQRELALRQEHETAPTWETWEAWQEAGGALVETLYSPPPPR